MGCYLCAYLSGKTPATPKPLPPTSPVVLGDPLGTCWRCWVWACAAHATRYGRYECAICTPAAAAETALGVAAAGQGTIPVGDGGEAPQGSAPALAELVGQQASTEQKARANLAIQRINADLRRPTIEGADGLADEQPNLVWDLATVIREEAPNLQFAHETEEDEYRADGTSQPAGRLSIDAIAADVRRRFLGADREAQLGRTTVETVTGALLLAVSIADQAVTRDTASRSIAPSDIEVRAPWEMTHPGLLDPVMWMVAVAYRRGN